MCIEWERNFLGEADSNNGITVRERDRYKSEKSILIVILNVIFHQNKVNCDVRCTIHSSCCYHKFPFLKNFTQKWIIIFGSQNVHYNAILLYVPCHVLGWYDAIIVCFKSFKVFLNSGKLHFHVESSDVMQCAVRTLDMDCVLCATYRVCCGLTQCKHSFGIGFIGRLVNIINKLRAETHIGEIFSCWLTRYGSRSFNSL